MKHDHVLEVGRRLPRARERVREDLGREGLTRERVLALAFALLDVAYLRIGNESYARENGSVGLSTLRRAHARIVDLVGGAGEPTTGASGVAEVVREVAADLGNTPAVCRASSVDPRVVDRWERGETIGRPRTLEGAERAVLRLLS